MARTHQQARFDLLVPTDVLDDLRRIGMGEETNIAELLRRVGDLIVTFDIPRPDAAIPPILAGMTTERFTYYIPPPQLVALTEAANARSVTIHELLRQGLMLYILRKRKAAHERSMRTIDPEPVYAPV